MPLTQELTQELNVLTHFKSDSTLDGIKVHHDAAREMVAATKRLYEKGLITENDGGYLTSHGCDVVEHLQAVLQAMKP